MRAVNLLPGDEQRKGLELGSRLPLFGAAAGVVLVTVVAMLLASTASSTADEQRSQLAAVEAEIDAIPTNAEPAVSQGTLVQERSDRIAALSAALTGRVAFDRVLREISFVLPKDAWLTQLEAAAPVSAAPTTPGAAPVPVSGADGVTIQGATYTHDTVAIVLARLAAVPSLMDVRLTASTLVEPQAEETQGADGQAVASGKRGKPFVTFVVSAALRTEGPS